MRSADRAQPTASRESPAAAPAARAAAPGPSPRGGAPTPAQALALQRTAGNRATGRILARWVKHPDPDKKGVMVPDSSSEAFLALNPPQNK